VGQIRASVLVGTSTKGIDPEQWWGLASELPYDVEVRWSAGTTDGSYDVLFFSRESRRLPRPSGAKLARGGRSADPRDHANDPLRPARRKELIAELRKYAQGQLPAYMAPTFWVVMDRLPLTSGGKLNTASLPLPERLTSGRQPAALHRNLTVSTLSEIWAQVLGIANIDEQENFFQLGGDSLSALQLVQRIRETFDLPVSPVAVFEAPTIAQMAALLDAFDNPPAGHASAAQSRGEARRARLKGGGPRPP